MPDYSVVKQKALEDAKKMQKTVLDTFTKAGKEPPPYQLSELIGKGSFGRVYKASSLTTKKLVAVKIIDIEESDTVDPKRSDTYSDLLKEINALKLLSDSGAKNINHVIEAIPVGQSMWVITEFCAGGSVSTLMKPTSPGGLQEKWIIPILREVAEAMFWVHDQGIIHRDIKCANVLVAEAGDVQLCDFGVAGVIETKFDKRTTVIGTPHWMAPELFDQTASYGTEVDIWAFGAMVYEIASGMPPNVEAGMDFLRIGNHLKHSTPRLEGDQHSAGLKDLVSFCLQHEPADRPTIQQIQRHKYLFKTEEAYPTASLSHLVRAFKMWEAQGGARKSLFSAGGAQGPSDISSTAVANDEWNFSTTASFDQQVLEDGVAQDVYDVYGTNVEFSRQQFEETKKPKTRRRGPPPQANALKAPLEKLFDPNTMSSYDENSRAYYGRLFPPPSTASDLPLRDDSAPPADVRESLIDLDASLNGGDLSTFVDLNTIRPGGGGGGGGGGEHVRAYTDHHISTDFYDNSFGDAGDRRTRDWKFPSMPSNVAGEDEFSRPSQPFNNNEPASAPFVRPPLLHHPTEPILSTEGSIHNIGSSQSVDIRASMGSLIDLDMSFADTPSTDYTRPSTSHSDVASVTGSEISAVNPFELEKHASLYVTNSSSALREPSIYVSDDSDYPTLINGTAHHIPLEQHLSPAIVSEAPKSAGAIDSMRPYSLSEFADMDPEETPQATMSAVQPVFPSALPVPAPIPEPETRPTLQAAFPRSDSLQATAFLPPMPAAPSARALSGEASTQDVKEELRRLAMSMGDHLNLASGYLSRIPVRRGSMRVDVDAAPITAPE